MNKKSLSFACLLVLAVGVYSCQLSDVGTNDAQRKATGAFSLSLQPNLQYTTTGSLARSTEADYTNLLDYMVHVTQDNNVLRSYAYGARPSQDDLPVGNYVVKVFKGDNTLPVAFDNMYVEGVANFVLEEGDTKNITVLCTPANVKLRIAFDTTMINYYSDYSALISTRHTTAPFVLSKDKKDEPLYIKAATGDKMTLVLKMVRHDLKVVQVTKEYTINPRDFLTVSVKPIETKGDVGLSITVDTSVNDVPINMEIPTDWLPSNMR